MGPKKKAIKGKSLSPSKLNIMVVRGTGKVRSFEVSPWILGLGFMFFIIYTIWSLIVVNRYFLQTQLVQSQTEQIRHLVDNLTEAKKEMHRARQRVALLEQRLKTKDRHAQRLGQSRIAQNTATNQDTKPKTKTTALSEPKPKQKTKQDQGSPAVIPPGPPKSQETEVRKRAMVDVKKPSLEVGQEKVRISFKLVNLVQGVEPVRGYVHIILMNKEQNPPKVWSARGVKLDNGLPIDYRDGQLFSIKRFRIIHGSSPLVADSGIPTSMRVLVFDRQGDLIFDREFELDTNNKRKT